MELNISIKENHKSLFAIESIDKDLLLSVVIKYLSEIDKSEFDLKMFTPFLINRLDNLFTYIINNFGKLTSEKLINMANIFINIDILSISNEIENIKNEIKLIPNFLTIEDINKTTLKFLNLYFDNSDFDFIDESKEYIRDIIINYNFRTEKQILSEIYWIYNKIKIGDTVKKVTKKGETIGVVKKIDNKLTVITDSGEFSLTSAWNKLSTRLNFSDIAYDIFTISSRLQSVIHLLKQGPIRAEIISIKSNNLKMPAILSYQSIENTKAKQIVFSDITNNIHMNSVFSFYNLNIDFEIEIFSSKEDILDCFISEMLLEKMQ